jgi:hypothetical protein
VFGRLELAVAERQRAGHDVAVASGQAGDPAVVEDSRLQQAVSFSHRKKL